MTFEELKIEAEKQGYTLIKKQPYVKLLPCTCGAKRIAVWFRASNSQEETGSFCKCLKCGAEGKVAKTQREARINWNNKVQQ